MTDEPNIERSETEVEGQGWRYGRDDSETAGTTDPSDAETPEESEVEGQAIRVKLEPTADVEGQAMKVKRDDSAAPESTDGTDGNDATDEPDVEGQGLKWK